MSLTTTLRERLARPFKNKNPRPDNRGPAPGREMLDAEKMLRFEIRETQLCAQLSLSKDELRRRRLVLLVQGTHWDYIDKRVLLNELGAEILRHTRESYVWSAELGDRLTNAATADCEALKGPKGLLLEKNPPAIIFNGKLLVWAVPRRNPRLVIAYLPGTDPANPLNLVTCLVRDNALFLRGMELPGPGRQVRQIDEQRYELQGAPPRYRGRW